MVVPVLTRVREATADRQRVVERIVSVRAQEGGRDGWQGKRDRRSTKRDTDGQ